MRRAAGAVIGIALLAAACSGSSPSTPSTLAPTPTPTPPPAASGPVELGPAGFDALVLAAGRPSLVEFQRPTCPYCQAMVPVVERLATDFSGRALVGTVNTLDHPALAQSHGVTGVPTFTFWKAGREVSRQVGTASYEQLAARLEALLATP